MKKFDETPPILGKVYKVKWEGEQPTVMGLPKSLDVSFFSGLGGSYWTVGFGIDPADIEVTISVAASTLPATIKRFEKAIALVSKEFDKLRNKK